MDLMELPKQYQLIYTLSKNLFLDKKFKCVALVSKTAYLTVLAACHGAKVEILPPYEQGTCLLLPKQDKSNQYIHAVIDETDNSLGNESFYWYKYRRARSNSTCDPGREAKPCSYIEQFGKIFPYETPENWLGKHDITSDNVNNLNNSSYPALIGHDAKTKLDYWKSVPLGISSNPQLSMENLLNLSSQNSRFSIINTYSPKSFNFKKFESQIWINEVPESIEQGRFLIILSPTHRRYQDLISQVNNIYAINRLFPVEPHNIPSDLKKLGITNRALSVITLMQESAL